MFQILIVDDDKNLKRALSLLLTDSGYRTFSAGSAREALHTLEKCRIDLMVLEAALPGMDGLALTKLLRDCSPPTSRRASSPAWMITSRNPSIPRNLPFGSKPFSAGQRSSPSTSWSSEKPLWTPTPSPSPPTAGSRSCPRRNFACSTSSSPTPTRYLPACSSWMTSGAPPPSPPPPPSVSTSTASETASAMQKTSPSSPSAASAIRHR